MQGLLHVSEMSWTRVSDPAQVVTPGQEIKVKVLRVEDGKIALWDVKEGKEIRNWAAHAGGASSVDFTPDGRLVSAGRDKLAKAWDQTGKVLLTSAPFEDIALRAVLGEVHV